MFINIYYQNLLFFKKPHLHLRQLLIFKRFQYEFNSIF